MPYQMTVESVRLEFESDLGLLAGLRQQQLAGIDADDRIVAGRIGDVGREAEIEIVDQAGASTEPAVFAALTGADVLSLVVETQSLRPLNTSVKRSSLI